MKCLIKTSSGELFTEASREFIESSIGSIDLVYATKFPGIYMWANWNVNGSGVQEIEHDNLNDLLLRTIDVTIYNAVVFVKYNELRPDYFDCVEDMDESTINEIKSLIE